MFNQSDLDNERPPNQSDTRNALRNLRQRTFLRFHTQHFDRTAYLN